MTVQFLPFPLQLDLVSSSDSDRPTPRFLVRRTVPSSVEREKQTNKTLECVFNSFSPSRIWVTYTLSPLFESKMHYLYHFFSTLEVSTFTLHHELNYTFSFPSPPPPPSLSVYIYIYIFMEFNTFVLFLLFFSVLIYL